MQKSKTGEVVKLGTRIKERRKELGLTQDGLARKMKGVDRASISQWENDLFTPKGENLHNLAKALDCEIAWLIGEKKASSPAPGLTLKAKVTVPVLTLDQARSWKESEKDCQEWRETTADTSQKSFAIRFSGDSMTNPTGFPTIPDGSIIIVDSEADPTNGNIVVALSDSGALVKRLAIDGPKKYFMSLNPNYPAFEFDDSFSIVGVVKKVEFDL